MYVTFIQLLHLSSNLREYNAQSIFW